MSTQFSQRNIFQPKRDYLSAVEEGSPCKEEARLAYAYHESATKNAAAVTLEFSNGEKIQIGDSSSGFNISSGHGERRALAKAINKAIKDNREGFKDLVPIKDPNAPSREDLLRFKGPLASLKKIKIFSERAACGGAQNPDSCEKLFPQLLGKNSEFYHSIPVQNGDSMSDDLAIQKSFAKNYLEIQSKIDNINREKEELSKKKTPNNESKLEALGKELQQYKEKLNKLKVSVNDYLKLRQKIMALEYDILKAERYEKNPNIKQEKLNKLRPQLAKLNGDKSKILNELNNALRTPNINSRSEFPSLSESHNKGSKPTIPDKTEVSLPKSQQITLPSTPVSSPIKRRRESPEETNKKLNVFGLELQTTSPTRPEHPTNLTEASPYKAKNPPNMSPSQSVSAKTSPEPRRPMKKKKIKTPSPEKPTNPPKKTSQTFPVRTIQSPFPDWRINKTSPKSLTTSPDRPRQPTNPTGVSPYKASTSPPKKPEMLNLYNAHKSPQAPSPKDLGIPTSPNPYGILSEEDPNSGKDKRDKKKH